MSVSPYDEVGSRTRQAWLRTSLGVVAVSLLVLRGMVIAGAGSVALVLALVPGIAFLAVSVLRMARLERAESPATSRSVGLTIAASALGLAVVAALSVALLR